MRSNPITSISVCIATYRRLDRLEVLLADLACQQLPPSEVIVVDNDPGGTARQVIERVVGWAIQRYYRERKDPQSY